MAAISALASELNQNRHLNNTNCTLRHSWLFPFTLKTFFVDQFKFLNTVKVTRLVYQIK